MDNRINFFISCARVDNQWAEWIVNTLEQEGYSTFWDAKGLKVENFSSIIRQCIEKTKVFIAIISPSYLSSTSCQAEVSIALDYKVEIIPVLISKVSPVGKLANYHCINLYHANEKQAKEKLLRMIRSLQIDPLNQSKLSINAEKNDRCSNKSMYPPNTSINNLQINGDELIIGGIDKVNAIKAAFDKTNTVSSTLTLSGEGGTGKTTIARKYIYQFGYLYNVIWWIRAISREMILQDYKDFAAKMKLLIRNKGEENSEQLINLVKQWMESNSNWLFVFDDVNDFDMVQSFFPEKHQGNILITSRTSLWKNVDISTIKIDVFSKETALRFLKSNNVKGTDKELEMLSKSLGNVPSNLKMAAKIITDNNLSISDFLNRLKTDQAIKPGKKEDLSTSNINIATVYKESGDYQNALKYYELALKSLGKNQNNKCIDIYNSIASIYQELGEYKKAEKIYRNLLETGVEELKKQEFDIIDIGIAYNNYASVLRQEAKYEEAIVTYEKALKIFKENSRNGHPLFATTLSNLAIVYRDVGQIEKALACQMEALSIRKEILGSNHPDTAKIYIYIGELYEIIQEYEKAFSFYKNALDIYNSALGKNNQYNSIIYNKIAVLYQKKDDYKQAEEYFNKALELRKNLRDSNEVISNTVNIINNEDQVTNIINLSEKPVFLDQSNSIVDKLTRNVLIKLEASDKKDFEIFNQYFQEFQRLVNLIKRKLVFETTEETEICHYSKLKTLKYIICEKNQPQPRLRISNIAYLNDPSEGRVLLQLLNKYLQSNVINNLFVDEYSEESKLTEVPFSKVFIGSFSTAKNKLPMWTLYGADSKGCCLVFDDYFFDKKNELIEIKPEGEEKNIPSQELTLYRVDYIDIDDFDESDLFIEYIKKIANILDQLDEVISKYEFVRIWVMTLLDEIRFLFKDCDYDYENEVRVIIHAENSEIQVDDGENELGIPKLYVDLQRKLNYKEIILGSKIDKPNAVAPFLLHSGMVKKVTKSGIHYQ